MTNEDFYDKFEKEKHDTSTYSSYMNKLQKLRKEVLHYWNVLSDVIDYIASKKKHLPLKEHKEMYLEDHLDNSVYKHKDYFSQASERYKPTNRPSSKVAQHFDQNYYLP